MNLKNILIICILWVCVGFSGAYADIVEGEDYIVLSSPQPASDAKQIEVLNFFWYDCPYCNTLHPHINTWLEDKPSDVSFEDIPTIFHASWIPAAKIFLTAKKMGVMDILHDQVFDAIHQRKINLNEERTLFKWVEIYGVEREEFIKAYQSIAVQKQIARATHMTRQYQLEGVPALVVGGKYLTNTEMGKTLEGTILVLDKLIEKTRREKIN